MKIVNLAFLMSTALISLCAVADGDMHHHKPKHKKHHHKEVHPVMPVAHVAPEVTTVEAVSSEQQHHQKHHTPYIGLGMGSVNTSHNINAVPANKINQSFNLSKQSFAGEILAGWMTKLPYNWMMGVELNYSLTSNEPDSNISDIRSSVKTNWAFGGGLRLGHTFSKATTVYVRAGFEYRNFRNKLTPTAAGVSPILNNSTKFAFAPAIGVEIGFAPHWAIGMEGRTAFYNTITNRGTNVSVISSKPRVSTFMLNLKYKFCGQY